MKTKSIIIGFLLVGVFICLSANVSAYQPSSLSLNDLDKLQTRPDYTPIGYKPIVEDMGKTVIDSTFSSFSSAFTSSSNAVGNIKSGKSWMNQGTLFNKIIRGTATMNDLASNLYTMQFSVSLPLLNTRNEHLGFALDELSDAFGVPRGPKYYDYIGRENGITTNYNSNNLLDISKIDWKIPKLEFPIVDFKKLTTPRLRSPTLKPINIETSSYSSPCYYNRNYNTINTPKLTMPRMDYNNIYSPGFSSSRNYYSTPSFSSYI